MIHWHPACEAAGLSEYRPAQLLLQWGEARQDNLLKGAGMSRLGQRGECLERSRSGRRGSVRSSVRCVTRRARGQSGRRI